MPEHCVMFLPVKDGKLNKTSHEISPIHCTSFCGISNPTDTVKANHVPESIDHLEIAIPENVDVIETSTASKISATTATTTTTTTKHNAIGMKSEPAEVFEETHANIEQNLAKNTTDSKVLPFEASMSHDAATDARNVNKEIVVDGQVEKPFDIAEVAHSTTAESIQVSNEHEPNSVYDEQNKLNKTKEMHSLNNKIRQTELSMAEPVINLHAEQTKFMENDIKTSFNKKYDRNDDDAEAVRAANIELMKTSNDDGNTLLPSPQPLTMPSSPSTIDHVIDVPASHASCFAIDLRVKSVSLNATLGTDEICHNFNITYNIPISKYMEENRIHLVFV